MPDCLCSLVFCFAIGVPATPQEVVPKSLVETICNDKRPVDERLIALTKAESYDALEPEDLRQLEELFSKRGDELYLSYDLVDLLRQFGDKHTLEVLLNRQKLAIRSNKKLFLSFAATLFHLAVKNKRSIEFDLLPPFRGVLAHRLLMDAVEYHRWSKTEFDDPVAAPDPE